MNARVRAVPPRTPIENCWTACQRPAIALALLVFAVAGCGPSTVPGTEPRADIPDKIVSGSPSNLVRLTQDHLDARNATQPLSLRIGPDADWVHLDGTSLQVTDTGLRTTSESGAGVRLDNLDIDARQYDVARVQLRVESGEQCALKWASDVIPDWENMGGVSVRTFADDRFHTYVVPLNPAGQAAWAGTVQTLILSFPGAATAVEVAWLEFVSSSPQYPTRITIQEKTCEALFGSQPAWKLTVPEEGVFETWLGIAQGEGENPPAIGKARYRAVLDSETAGEVVLIDKTVVPETAEGDRYWQRAEADLKDYAGSRVHIRLEVDNLGSPIGDRTYWGNPTVFSRSRNDATPVVLVSWDTVRADHLSCYGYDRETTPHLDEWAQEAVLFETAISDEPWTLSGHASMLTGLYPKHHGVTCDANLSEDIVTLPEHLRDNGYLTAGFTGFRWWLEPWRGFCHGFDMYDRPRGDCPQCLRCPAGRPRMAR